MITEKEKELNKTVFKGQCGKCAKETLKYLVKRWLEGDVHIYVNGYRISYHDSDWDVEKRKFDFNKIKVEPNMNPKHYFTYAGSFMSMSFEGGLYDEINYGSGKTEMELDKIFEKYGKYHELGDAWNLTLCNI